MRRQPIPRAAALSLLVLSGTGGAACVGGGAVNNYTDQPGPRFAAAPAVGALVSAGPDLRVVTWNLKWGKRSEDAARALGQHPALRDADLILMQEMDEAAVATVARRLGLGYVYYPSTLHPRVRRHFGNAILSPWPLIEDRKITLPRTARFMGTRRAAVMATALVRGQRIRIYSLHLATPFEIGPTGIEDQLRAVIRDAAGSPDPVVIAGDLNSSTVGGLLVENGYQWLTRHVGPTAWVLPIDHVFVRGRAVTAKGAGAVDDDALPSDHRPVWAVIQLAQPTPPASPPGR